MRDFFCSSKNEDTVLNSKRFCLYASGRAALYHGILSLDLPSDSNILIPSFHCGVEVEAVIRAGYHVDFYNIKRDLRIDINDLLSRLNKKTKALVVIHYFGFPQTLKEIIELCDEKKVHLIEDCAHALYSRYNNKWLGTFGSLGIFSLQKTIPLPNGGGVLINKEEIPRPELGDKYTDLALIKSAIRSILEYESGHNTTVGKLANHVISAYRFFIRDNVSDVNNLGNEDLRWYYNVPQYDYKHDIWLFSRPFIGSQYYPDIVEKRRKNYEILESLLHESETLKPAFPYLSSGVCPLCFPIFVDQSDRFVRKLNRRGILPFVFGRFPHPLLKKVNYPDSCFLSENLLGLPVQQQLGERKCLSLLIHLFKSQMKSKDLIEMKLDNSI